MVTGYPSSMAESETEPITELLRELGSLVVRVEAPPWIELRASSIGHKIGLNFVKNELTLVALKLTRSKGQKNSAHLMRCQQVGFMMDDPPAEVEFFYSQGA
ncbi:Uncharacterized protein Fot_56596 [Forsythia ovata]|uniref:Uncharacterized protein n=1 Tax=Forsythia ovata TaxID=205694 RepID=A0ABD1NZT4_9LAMI